MLPPLLGDEQVNCGPYFDDDFAPDGRVRSLQTPAGDFDLAAIAAQLPPEQAPDVVACLVDASWCCTPRNLGAFKCPRVVLIADTHHLRSPLIGMMRYVSSEPFHRAVLLYDRHHAALFRSVGLETSWLPGLTFPHADEAVRAARQEARSAQLAFVGQAGKLHPQRMRWLQALGVPASVAAGLTDWTASSTRRTSDWQVRDGIGASRANQLVAFFDCPAVRAEAARLHAAGVQGF